MHVTHSTLSTWIMMDSLCRSSHDLPQKHLLTLQWQIIAQVLVENFIMHFQVGFIYKQSNEVCKKV